MLRCLIGVVVVVFFAVVLFGYRGCRIGVVVLGNIGIVVRVCIGRIVVFGRVRVRVRVVFGLVVFVGLSERSFRGVGKFWRGRSVY